MSFEATFAQHFPGAVTVRDFVRTSYRALEEHGFDDDNTIACVGACRDEITRPLSDEALRAWGEAFNFSSLAGMLTLGRTGFGAARQHAPRVGGRERFAFLAMPHIGISEGGAPGLVRRKGQTRDSAACGALEALRSHIDAGELREALDPDDLEQSLLELRLRPLLPEHGAPSLVELTRLAQRAILEDLERLIAGTDMTGTDYAVLTGIQIHGPADDFVWPCTTYAVIDGARIELST